MKNHNLNNDETEFLSLEEIQGELLKILVEFDGFCKEHGLRYSLDSGTLLGAVRHQGFIPWDDDLDVSMPRPDYERLIALCPELPKNLVLLESRITSSPTPFAKLCVKGIRAQEPALEGKFEELLWMDIFPMDGVPDDEESLRRLKFRFVMAIRGCKLLTVRHCDESLFKRIIKYLAAKFVRLLKPNDLLLGLTEHVVADYRYEASNYVSCLLGMDKDPWRLPREQYESMVELEFEGHLFSAMSCWDKFLSDLYGDYMQLPNEDDRNTHCLKVWKEG